MKLYTNWSIPLMFKEVCNLNVMSDFCTFLLFANEIEKPFLSQCSNQDLCDVLKQEAELPGNYEVFVFNCWYHV